MPISGPISEFQANQTSIQTSMPSVATDGIKTFVFVWEGDTPSRVLGAIYEKGTLGLTRVSPVNDQVVALSSFGNQGQTFVSMNAQKRFCVTWTDFTLGPVQGRVVFKVFADDFSTPISAETFVPNPHPSSVEQSYSKTAFSDTDTDIFAIAWIERTAASINIVRVAIYSMFDNLGSPGLTLLNCFDITTGNLGDPSAIEVRLGVNGLTGEFFVVWESDEISGPNLIKGQKFDRTGTIGPIFVISDPLNPDDATQPRIAVRPYTNEFIVSWMHPTPLVTNDLFYEVFWRRMKVDTTSPESIIEPPPGIIQIPGAVAAFQGSCCSYGDGSFIVSWVDQYGITILATEYGWEDVPTPVTVANAPIIPSSGAPHGGIGINNTPIFFATSPEMVVLGDVLVAINGEFSFSSILARCVNVTDRFYVSDYLTKFTAPAIFGAAAVDSVSNSMMQSIFTDLGYPGITSEPEARTTTDIDAFLNTQDLVLVGGPIANSMSNDIMSQSGLNVKITDTEAIQMYFSLAGDGQLLGSLSPQGFINNQNNNNQNNPSGLFTLERSQATISDPIIDYSTVFRVNGTSRKLMLLAGIREFGSAVAAYVLSNVKAYIDNLSSNITTRRLRLWTSLLNNQKCVVIKFEINPIDNTGTISNVLSAIDSANGAGVVLIPSQSVRSNNP